jgi:hypothetical protein
MAKDKIKATDSAYPCSSFNDGMDLRTALAKDAMTGILAGKKDVVFSQNEINEIAQNAVKMAENNITPEPTKFDVKITTRIPMTKWEKIRLIGATIGLFICVGALIYLQKQGEKEDENYVRALNLILRMTKEQGYAEGQAAAMKGEIRIIKINDTTYVWASAPFGNRYPVNDTIHTRR